MNIKNTVLFLQSLPSGKVSAVETAKMNSSNVVVDLAFLEKETLQDCIFLFVT
jgi:hypothetical protein